MKKKLLKIALATACLLSSVSVSAYDFEVDGIYYDVVSFSELTCKIVKGNDQSFYEGDFVIPATVNYNNKTLTVVEIAGGIFNNCSELTSITIPNTISSIGDRMFSGCSKLEHVTIEDGETVLELGIMDRNYSASRYYGLFSYCPITSVYIGRNLLYERYYGPFSYVETLKEAIIGDSVTEIDDYMFRESGLTNVTIGNSVTTIGYCSFYECSNLTGLTIPNSVTTIESSAFFGCNGLTNLTIPNSVTTINTSAFMYCSGLTSLTIPNSVTTIGSSAFEYCSGLTSLTIPNSVTSLGSYVFYGCSGLVNVIIGNSVTKIDWEAFAGCKSLTSITIPNSVTSLGRSAFENCSGLVNVTLGSSVAQIGDKTFAGCSSLTELYSYNINPPSVGSDNFTNNQYMTLNIYVPNEALETYQNADTWNNFWNIQGFEYTGVETIKANNKSTDKYYDIRGNRLDSPKRGLNIINGKKVIMK